MNYLSEEEQYKEILNNEEISRIKDPLLMSIRMKYWELRREAFLDERKIPDTTLEKVYDEITRQEHEEINKYRTSKKS